MYKHSKNIISMKNIILYSILSIFIVLTSCEKDLEKPENNVVSNVEDDEDFSILFDKDWVLVSGNFYYEDPKIYYTHPNNSFLNPFYGAENSFDSINVGQTTWRFNKTQFFLNGVLQSGEPNLGGVDGEHLYLYIDKGNGMIETRVVEIVSLTEERLEVRLNEIGTLIGNPHSVLVFRSVPSIQDDTPYVPYGYQHQGVLNTNSNNNDNISKSDLYDTKWVVTKFYNGFGYDLPNDTLEFLDNDQYTINGVTNGNRTFNVITIVGNTSVNLDLNDFLTMGGNNYRILTSSNFINDGIINGSQAGDILNPNNSNKFIWMEKIN